MTPAFSSSLGVGETFAVRDAGLIPIRQVMGAAYHRAAALGVALRSGASGSPEGRVTELDAPTGAWNDARTAAVRRLREEAAAAGADAVVGVSVRRSVRGWAGGLVEVVAIGTAVRAAPGTWLPRPDRDAGSDTAFPALCSLSGQDAAKLLRHGFRPVGIVGGATVLSVTAGGDQIARTRNPVTARRNQELPDFSRGISTARELVMARVTEQAQELGADGVVGVQLDRVERAHDTDEGPTSRLNIILELHVLGTAIAGPSPGDPDPDPTTLLPL